LAILVKVYATLRQFTGGESTLYIEGAETIHALLKMIGFPEDEVKNVMVNGRRREHDYMLTDGDRVALFPPIAGG